ncbi:MAG: uroporphyrinogen decarboxylase family protein [Capsulimonadaceae bacterium]|nr:uroporphyrinogen decarboxylase family protein [Capsulimonadaceae bacterium]
MLQWEPAIYEHKAALIGRDVFSVATSAKLLTEAMVAEYECYSADWMTVGLDIYNVEAEALGAYVTDLGRESCPDIVAPPWDLDALPPLSFPAIPGAGRLQMLLDTGHAVQSTIGRFTRIRIAVSGPVSLASKLVGLEPLLMGLAANESSAQELLAFAASVVEAWSQHLRQSGLDVIVFDSAASPPMFSPALYRRAVFPLHQRLMTTLAKSGQIERPLIIGGDTATLLPSLAHCGASTILCDSASNAVEFANAESHDRWTVRRNTNASLLPSENWRSYALQFAQELRLFPHVIAGTGVLSYDANPQHFRRFRECVERDQDK